MQNTVKKNLLQVQEEIAPCKPNIIAVTKYFNEDAIIEAYEAGIRDFAESRAIEAIEKINNLPQQIRMTSKFHFIGHLQTNKVKKVVQNFDYIHSVDSLKLAKIISEEAEKIGKVQNILIQVNNANEIQKTGFSRDEISDEFNEIKNLEFINVVGLMSMAPIDATQERLEFLFSDIARLKEELQVKYKVELKELSMGMSQDYKVAVRCGATMLRLGRILFK